MVYQYFFMPKPVPQTRPKADQAVTEGTQTQAQTQEQQQPAANTTPAQSGQAMDYSTLRKKKRELPQINTGETLLDAVKENLVATEEHKVTVDTELFTATFMSKGAALESFVLKKYNDDLGNPMEMITDSVKELKIYPLFFSPWEEDDTQNDLAALLNKSNFVYGGTRDVSLHNGETRSFVFKFADVDNNISITKTITIRDNSYVVGLDYNIVKDGKALRLPIVFGPGLENNESDARVMQTPLSLGTFNRDDFEEYPFEGAKFEAVQGKPDLMMANEGKGGGFEWVSYQTNYFAAIFKTNSNIRYQVFKEKVLVPDEDAKDAEKMKKVDRISAYLIMGVPQSFYLGPKDEAVLSELERDTILGYTDVNKVVDYGWSLFGIIAKILLKGILFVYSFVPNMGWALILFTIFIKIILFPLTYASSVSMAKMQTLQPKIKAIKKKYKNNKDPEQRKQMNVETMALYKSEKVNPAGGCLPMLLQMPILFAFFRLLPVSINFRHEPWLLWITDLSIKDPIYLLPILMGAAQMISSKMTPTSGDSAQKKMMYIMPAVMVFLFMNYSAGLNLYWFISNLLQVVQQYFINKKIFHDKKVEDSQRKAVKRKKGAK